MGIISQVLKPSKIHKQSRHWIHNLLAVPTLFYGSDASTLKVQDKFRITTAEMKFLRKPTKYMLFDHKIIHHILKECEMQPVVVQSNMLVEWTDPDLCRPLWNTSHQEKQTQNLH
jgi:hypothetical protein